MINRFLHSWSIHMKFMKFAKVSFHKFHIKYEIYEICQSLISYEMTMNVRSSIQVLFCTNTHDIPGRKRVLILCKTAEGPDLSAHPLGLIGAICLSKHSTVSFVSVK